MNSREIELKQLGFEKNPHQQCYGMYKYGSMWTLNFWDVYEPTDYDWECYLENLKYELREAEKQWYEDLRESDGYNFAQKEIKQKLLDKLNHLRSDYQQQTQSKLGRSPNYKYETELLSKIELLKELMDDHKRSI